MNVRISKGPSSMPPVPTKFPESLSDPLMILLIMSGIEEYTPISCFLPSSPQYSFFLFHSPSFWFPPRVCSSTLHSPGSLNVF